MASDEDVMTYELFISTYRKRFRQYAAGLCREHHAAEDVVQEALITMYRRWDNISPEARLGYAYVVIRNLVIHFHRSLQMRREASLDELALDVAANVDADIGDLTVRAPAIEQALGQLPERQRRALYLRYWQGLPTAEIAKVLKIPAGTVRSDLTRASAQLRAALRPGF